MDSSFNIDTEQITKSIQDMSNTIKEALNEINLSISQVNVSGSSLGDTINTVTSIVGTATGILLDFGKSGLTAESALSSMHAMFSNLAGSVGIASLAITGIVSVVAILCSTMDNEFQKRQETISKIHEEINARDELTAKQNEQLNSSLSEISNIKELNQELSTLVDENGNVKEGYENRASFITSVLNKALGTNLNVEKGVIAEYKNSADSIKQKIALMQAEAILEAQYPKYQKAKENLSAAKKKADELEIQMSKDKMAMQEKEREFNAKNGDAWKTAQDARSKSMRDEYNQLKQNFDSSQSAYELQKGVVEGYYDDIALYETNYALAASGNIDNINSMQTETLVRKGEIKESKKALLEEEIADETDYMNRLIELKDQAETEEQQKELEREIATKEAKIQSNQDEIDAMIAHGEQIAELKQVNNAKELEDLSAYISQKQSNLMEMYATEEECWTDEQKAKAESLKKSIDEELATYTKYASDKVGKAVELSSKLNENSTQEEKDAAAAAMREAQATLEIMGQNVHEKLATLQDLRIRKANGEKGITQDMIDEAERQAVEAEKGYGKVAKKIEKSWKDLPDNSKKTFKDVMAPMLQEMEEKEPTLFEKAGGIASGILGRLKKSFDIHSPSRKVREIFKYVMEGAEVGLDDETPELMDQTEHIAENVLNVFSKVNDADVKKSINKMKDAMNSEQMHMRGIVNTNLSQELRSNQVIKLEIPKLEGTMKGKIENHILMDGRETAVQLAPFISEEVAFSSR